MRQSTCNISAFATPVPTSLSSRPTGRAAAGVSPDCEERDGDGPHDGQLHRSAESAGGGCLYLCIVYVADKGDPLQLLLPPISIRKATATTREFTTPWGRCWESSCWICPPPMWRISPAKPPIFAYSAPYYTASNQEVYQSGGLPTPHLQGVYSAYDSAEMVEKYLAGSMSSTCTITWAELKQKLETQLGSAVDTDAAAGPVPHPRHQDRGRRLLCGGNQFDLQPVGK